MPESPSQIDHEPAYSQPVRSAIRTTLLSSIVGTTMEWYDFYLYATAAATVFNRLFFPSYSPLTGTLLAYGTFAVGFFVRPLGGLTLGLLGDRIGRKQILVITLLLMGGSTTAIGFLPTYAQIGFWSPLLLTVLRAIQGFGSGAEYAGAVLMVVEYAPREKRGLYGSLPYIGVAAGLLLSLVGFSWASSLPDSEFDSWGWRIPFLLSSLVIGLGILLRTALQETPEFLQIRAEGRLSEHPLRDLFKVARRQIFCAWGARLGDNSLAYIYESFVIVYATQQLRMEKSRILSAVIASSAAQFVTVPFFGWLSDRIGRKPVYLAGAVLSGAFAIPFFAMIGTGSTLLLYLALFIVSSVAKIAMTSAQSSWFAEMFPSRLRYTGFTLARELTSPISGGIAPVIATALLAAGAGSPHLVAYYLMLLAGITAVSVSLGPETRGRSLE